MSPALPEDGGDLLTVAEGERVDIFGLNARRRRRSEEREWFRRLGLVGGFLPYPSAGDKCGESGMLRAGLLVGPVPELPRIVSARAVTGTKYGKAVRVSYCFRSLPSDPRIRPMQLHLTVDNLSDDLPPLSLGWQVTKRCATVDQPVGPLKPPYVLRYSVVSKAGTWSKQGQMRL